MEQLPAVEITRLRAGFIEGWTGTVRTVALGAAIAAAYVIAAKVGFHMAFVAEQVTTVWAPTGIGMASLLIFGRRLWPAIWVGAFLVNAGTAAPVWTACLLATGNALESVAAAWVLGRIPGFDFSFRRVRDVIAFVGVGVVVCTTVSATIGAATLSAAGVQPWWRFRAVWFDWWFGDALGALVVAPVILTMAGAARPRARDLMRILLFVAASAVITQVVFGRLMDLGAHPLEYVVFPLVIAAALGGGPPASAAVVLASSIVTVWNTVRGAGPFNGTEVHHTLVLLQTFTGVLATTGLLLGAAIAERKTIEDQADASADTLRQREEMLRLAQRAGGVATFEWDFQNQVANCSAEFFAIFGLPADAGTMQGADWAAFVHPEDRDRMGAHLAGALAGTEPASADYRIRRADGRERWLSYTGQVEQTPHGARMLGTVLDITDRKRLEDELRRHAESAEAANRIKDEFLATLSHELRTPLNVVLGYARMLQTESLSPEDGPRAIEAIARNAEAQGKLIEDLLDISRITRGQMRLEPSRVDVAALLVESAEGVRPAADAKRITLEVGLDAGVGPITGDGTRLQQVLWNLLTNAVKFTDRGGRVRASVARSSGDVELTVSDTGVGIDPDFLPFVFEPFRQADPGLARRHGGLGLGLAISKKLVELHGGTIVVRSEGAGRGATFVVRLPGAR
jgi:PAS domain S-box-containing protein